MLGCYGNIAGNSDYSKQKISQPGEGKNSTLSIDWRFDTHNVMSGVTETMF